MENINLAECVILYVVDGMRPDGMLLADAPNLQRLRERGAYSLTAQTVMPSITLPTHMSMFHAVTPQVHGVTDNCWQPMPGGFIPGIVELVRQAQRKAAAFYTWDELRDLSRPGALAYSSFMNIYAPGGETSDGVMARLAADYFVEQRPDFMFVYYGMVDETGHQYGWMSPEYLAQVSAADAAIGGLLDRVEADGLLEQTAVLVTADHGGHAHDHGADIPEDMTIPWLLSGPGIRREYPILSPVHILDTAPTIAHLLGLPLPAAWQGRPVLEALE